jgi:hypothetical protein
MFRVQVPNEIIEYCQIQVDKYNFGKRKEANGTKEQQLTGIIGQSVIMKLFNFDLINGEDGCDNGIDIEFLGFKIDVKTMGRKTEVKRSYTNNFLKVQDYFNTDIYFFCSYNKENHKLTFCGWIDKKTFVSKRKYFPIGTTRTRTDGSTFITFSDLYEIDVIDLNDARDVNDLKQQILTFSQINQINEN